MGASAVTSSELATHFFAAIRSLLRDSSVGGRTLTHQRNLQVQPCAMIEEFVCRGLGNTFWHSRRMSIA